MAVALGRLLAYTTCAIHPEKGSRKITQQITRHRMIAVQRLESVHHTEVGYVLKREYAKNRPGKCKTLTSETQSRLCHRGILETQFEELLMSIKRQDKSFPFTLILLHHPCYKLLLPFSYLKK